MAERKPHTRTAAPRGAATQQASKGQASSRRQSSGAAGGARRERVQAQVPAQEKRRGFPLKGLAIALGCLITLAVAGALALVVLSHTSAFSITSIDAESTEHVSAADIAALAGIPEGTTLLNYDEVLIVENLRRNPWIKDVTLSREFPDRLKVTVTERNVAAIVIMNSGSVVWSLGDDDVWIEPVKLQSEDGQSLSEAALASVADSDVLLISDAPQTVNPVAGQPANDDVFIALRSFREELSPDFWNQIVSFSAPSVEGIACVLESGIEVSLGSPTSISSKEAVVQQLIAKYPNRLTYINVRVPSNPSYRMLDTESVEGGSGALGDLTSSTPSPAE